MKNSKARAPRKTAATGTSRTNPSRTKPRPTGLHRFAVVRGKTVEFVEFHTDSGHHVLEIRFADQTTLYFIIEPCEPTFTVEPIYSRWKEGNERILKRWKSIHCS